MRLGGGLNASFLLDSNVKVLTCQGNRLTVVVGEVDS